jgi:hypothetical protein
MLDISSPVLGWSRFGVFAHRRSTPMLHAFNFAAKVQKFLDGGLAGSCRVFTQKSKKILELGGAGS